MLSIIDSLSGITLFSKVFNEFCKNIDNNISYDLIGGFITAIKQFSKQFGQLEIRQIEMDTLKLLIYEKFDVMIFFLLDHDDKIKEYKKSLVICMNVFLKMFKADLKDNVNNTTYFQDFNSIIYEILKIPPEKIEPSCLNCAMGQKTDCLFNQVKNKIAEYKKKSIKITEL